MALDGGSTKEAVITFALVSLPSKLSVRDETSARKVSSQRREMQFILVHKHGRCDVSLSLLSMHLGDVSEANHKLFRIIQNACVARKKEA